MIEKLKRLIPSNKFSFAIKASCIVALLVLLVTIGIYVYQFGYSGLSQKAENWGQFGDYLGGTLAAAFSVLSFFALLITIYIQSNQQKLSSRAISLAERPWLSLDVNIDENIMVSESAINFSFKFIIENVGKTPAVNVEIKSELINCFLNGTMIEKMKDIQSKELARRKKTDFSMLGITVFPHKVEEVIINIPLSFDQIEAERKRFHKEFNIENEQPETFINPELYACLSYFSAFDSDVYTTSLFAQVRSKGPVNKPALGIRLNAITKKLYDGKCRLLTNSMISGTAR